MEKLQFSMSMLCMPDSSVASASCYSIFLEGYISTIVTLLMTSGGQAFAQS